MERRPLKRLGAMVIPGLAMLVLAACNSANGTNGTNGTNSTTPATSASSYDAATWSGLKLSANVTKAYMSNGTPVVTFKVTDQNGNPIKGLAVPYTGSNFPGMTQYPPTVGTYPNFAFTFAKLEPATQSSPSRWVSYLVVGGTSAAPTLGFPEPNSNGSLVDNGDGTYTYTYSLNVAQAATMAGKVTLTSAQSLADLDNLNYESSLVHRIGIVVGGNQPTSAAATQANANTYYDFVPATGAPADAGRSVVAEASCNQCHTALSMHYPRFVGVSDPNVCVTCHTDQMKFGYPEDAPAAAQATPAPANGAVTQGTALQNTSNTQRLYGYALGNFTNMVHKIHQGSNLWYSGYNLHYAFNSVTYPQDVRNCTTCHTNGTVASNNANLTAQGDNWFAKPSRLACGACHDQVNFATGLNHSASQYVENDDNCSGCHSQADIQIEHQPILAGNGNNAQQADYSGKSYAIATNPMNLPSNTGANTPVHTIIGQIISAGITPNATYPTYLGNPTVTFSLYADNTNGTPLTLNPQLTSAAATNLSMIAPLADGTTLAGGPSVLLAMGYPQDGITPADYNYDVTAPLVGMWNLSATGTKVGTITGSNGVYTVTFTGVLVPAGTSTMILGLGEGSTLVQTNLGQIGGGSTSQPFYDFTYTSSSNAGGVQVPFATVWKSASFKTTVGGSTNSIARRTIVKQDACNTCHSNLGAFGPSANLTNPISPANFHQLGNNDATSCVVCHNTVTNHTSGGFDVNAKVWVHGIHANGMHEYPYAPMNNFPSVTYPGVLNNCEACHVPGSYDFSNPVNAGQIGNLLWETMAGTFSGTQVAKQTPGTLSVQNSAAVPAAWGPTTGTAYGSFFSMTLSGTSATINQPTGTSLVSSPITAACMSCHDDMGWYNQHIKPYGGYWYTARSTVNANYGTTPTLTNTETCLNCHGTGKQQDIRTVHMNF